MKVFLADSMKLRDYSLPEKVEDQFVISYVSPNGIEETLALTAENNNWYISSGADKLVYKDTLQITKEALSNESVYRIKFNDLEEYITLYCYDTPIEYKDFSIGNRTTIQLGNTTSFDISYDNPYTYAPHFKIYLYNGFWVIESTATDNGNIFFVNKERTTKRYLRLGDVIFVNGLKLIWMATYIRMNNPGSKVATSLEAYQEYGSGTENTYTPVKDTEKNLVLYNDNQVFFHTPRLTKSITNKKITIEKPPEKKTNDSDVPAILTYGATIMMGISSSMTGVIAIFSVINGKGKVNIANFITEIVVCISMLLGSMFFPIISDKFRKKAVAKREKKRQERYLGYLGGKVTQINEELKKETQILFENNLSPEEIKKCIVEKNNKIWSREIADDDFLSLRVGIGNKKSEIEIEAQIEEFSMEDDNLRDEVIKVKESPLILNNVPITISLLKDHIFPVVITPEFQYRQSYIDNLMLQLISYYSGMDLKIAVLTTPENEKTYEYFKYLPHVYTKDRDLRLFGTNEDEYKAISQYLEQELSQRLSNNHDNDDDKKKAKDDNKKGDNNKYKDFDQYYLIITDNYLEVKRLGIIDKIMDIEANYGFSLLTIEKSMSLIPSKCNKFIEINNRACTIYDKKETDKEPVVYKPEFLNVNIADYARILANIPAVASSLSSSLPPSLNFLEMYKVGRIEQLNIVNRWQNNDPTISLHTPLGVRPDGKLLEIDLHEKYHGPHGLIAGSTGSGKSEFIITFILSMALNYHPYEVQFVLIDYKGGGLAGAFENRETGVKIPHLVGTITNLDTNEMKRTLVSINSELKRRQRKFNEARDALGESTVDIYKYQQFYREGKVKEPISHLFIISDEFAELKSQQPDFMDELISTARIGRSLGVHLILATQKPSGVVDDQIWSNTKFRICLKVATTEDSREMLGKNDAAFIKEAGRFILQVGNDELFEMGQSGWTGAKYVPKDYIAKQIDDSIDFIDNNANIVKKVNDAAKQDTNDNIGDQLTNMVKTLYNLSQRENVNLSQLWLPAIPKEIYLSKVIEKYKFQPQKNIFEAIIGEYDDPTSQRQDLLKIDLTENGNTIIYGNTGSGKENMLMTMIYSLCTTHTSNEINFYILDFGAEVLRVLNELPQVSDVVLSDEEEKVKSLCLMLDRELSNRKSLFSEYGGSYTSYIKQSKKEIPLIVTVLNGYESFAETYSGYLDYLTHILRDGSKYGIIFMTTASAVNSVPSTVSQNYNYQIATQLKDDFDYKYYFKAPLGLTPAKNFGRGIITINDVGYEFQTAYIYFRDQINDVIKSAGAKLSTKMAKAKKIPVIPLKVNSSTLAKYITDIQKVPVGVNAYTAEVSTIDLLKNGIYRISGNDVLFKQEFIVNLVNVLNSLNDCKVRVLNFSSSMLEIDGIDIFSEDFTTTIKGIIKEDSVSKVMNIYVVLGIGKIYDTVLDDGIKELFTMFNSIDKYQKSKFVLIDNFQSFKRVINEKWYEKINKGTGIWLGEDIDIQSIITTRELTSNEINATVTGLLYNINDSDVEVVKGLGVNGDDSY